MTLKFDGIKKQLFSNPDFVAAFEKTKPEFELAAALIKSRLCANLSQAEVAKRMGTTQSVIARLESGNHMPTLKSIQKYAQGVN